MGQRNQTTQKKKSIAIKAIENAIKQAQPKVIDPELATLVQQPPQGKEWLHEIKWDGYRIIACINKEVKLLTRHHHDWSHHFPVIVTALKELGLRKVVMDGELVALDKQNQPNFQLLQNYLEDPKQVSTLVYYVFDIIYYQGFSLFHTPLIKRKALLQSLLNQTQSSLIQYNDHIVGNGSTVFHKACRLGLEGIVSKKISSAYIQKRTREWLKIKCLKAQELVIGGYTDPKSSRQYFGALLLGFYDQAKRLIYCGKVGTGFSQTSLKSVAERLKKIASPTCPFSDFPLSNTHAIHWAKPILLAEIEYRELTQEGILRHPSFKGLREDKSSQEVTLELPTTIHTTHLEKVLYPSGITKRDVLDYYDQIADRLLPYIINRPLTLVRCPNGIEQPCFFQKHPLKTMPKSIRTIKIKERENEKSYCYITDKEGLLTLVQMGVLEFHPWGSCIDHLDQPDRIVFDLDPAPGVPWKAVINAALLLHQCLDELALKNFVKTTGGKGLHIMIPIEPRLDWELIKRITHAMANVLVAINPDQYIATMSKEKRKDKIFIDYLRNTRGATAIATYSTRARPGAPIAMPLTWDSLSTRIKSNRFDISNINKYLKQQKSDPWEDFFSAKQKITDKIEQLLLR